MLESFKTKRFINLGLIGAACMSFAAITACNSDSSSNYAKTGEKTKKQIIFMVPDGMGLSNVTAARIYKNGPGGEPLEFEKLPYIGYQRTHSLNSTVTDSAAAASAWASGEKFQNGEISCLDLDGDGACDGTRKNEKTVLEIAKDLGMAAGLVATSDITHATPAVFAAHVHNRKCETEIFRQMLEKDVDVMLGAGVNKNRSSCKLDPTDGAAVDALIQSAQNSGYAYATTKGELASVSGSEKILGLFKPGGMTPVVARGAANEEPTLTEMTDAALKSLETNEIGFFLMIEGSQIDWANHDRNAMYQINETLDFDNAVKLVSEWINANEDRKDNTLLVVVADHETGGVIIDGPYGTLSAAGDTSNQLMDKEGSGVVDEDGNAIMAPDMTILFGSNPEKPTSSANHTAVDTIIWSNSAACGSAMDNTDLYNVMVDFLNN